MAAAIKALNAKIRSNKYADYFCSTRTYCPPSAVFPRGHPRRSDERRKFVVVPERRCDCRGRKDEGTWREEGYGGC
jgi:hypothetical protein